MTKSIEAALKELRPHGARLPAAEADGVVVPRDRRDRRRSRSLDGVVCRPTLHRAEMDRNPSWRATVEAVEKRAEEIEEENDG